MRDSGAAARRIRSVFPRSVASAPPRANRRRSRGLETEGVCAGVVRLHSLLERDRRARLAIGLLHPDLLARGTSTSAIRILLRHEFDTLQLHRVDLRVLSFNVRAVRCYEKCGFVREGIERDSAFVDGAW